MNYDDFVKLFPEFKADILKSKDGDYHAHASHLKTNAYFEGPQSPTIDGAIMALCIQMAADFQKEPKLIFTTDVSGYEKTIRLSDQDKESRNTIEFCKDRHMIDITIKGSDASIQLSIANIRRIYTELTGGRMHPLVDLYFIKQSEYLRFGQIIDAYGDSRFLVRFDKPSGEVFNPIEIMDGADFTKRDKDDIPIWAFFVSAAERTEYWDEMNSPEPDEQAGTIN